MRLWALRLITYLGRSTLHRVLLDSNKPGLWICEHFFPFINDPETNLWLLPLFPPTSIDNGIYPMSSYTVAAVPKSADEIPDELQELRQQCLMEHHRLGHPSQKRQAALEIDGQPKPKVPKLACPTCLASKARKINRPPASTKEDRSTVPWEDIHSDLSGKISTQSARGYKYFVVFVCTYTGAKHVEFLAHKNHFIHAYRRLVLELGAHPKTFRTDQGTEYLNKEMTALLETNYVRHVVAAVNEHYSNGAAEHVVHTIRATAKTMLLHANIPKKYWCYAISHATYLNNMTSSSRANRSKTIYEILFRRRPDITCANKNRTYITGSARIPPYGAFTCIYKERRDLKDQRFSLTSIQGAFIGIAHHRKTLGYCIADGTRVSCTRHHIAFDPYLYPFKLNATAPPAWQTFHNLTTAKPQAAIRDFTVPQTTKDLPHTAELPDNSDESDFDPEIPAPASTSVDIDDIKPELIDSDSDEEHMVPAVTEPPMITGRSTRVRQAPVSFKARARQTTYDRYNHDESYSTKRNALVNTNVRKYFPGYGTFKGIITSYNPITDTYHILYDDGDEEVDTYDSIQKYIEGTPEYDQ
jgi:hypothetical protein